MMNFLPLCKMTYHLFRGSNPENSSELKKDFWQRL
jgi:hypothetical protein